MLKRVLVAVVGIPLLILILSLGPDWAAAVLLALMCGVGAWELLRALKVWERKRLALSLCAGWVPLLAFLGSEILPFFLLLLLFALFFRAIRDYEQGRGAPFFHLASAVFAVMVFPLMLSCLLRLRLLSGGQALVFVPLCICFGSDTLALFAGMLFGKHKLSPKVSPKKTVEGAVGGLVGGVAGLAILKGVLALLERLGHGPDASLSWLFVAVAGVVGGAVSQLGDLSFSVIKREYGVKDYGSLLPGHGGVLDRFDSVTFVAPLVWWAVSLLGVR